jgi:hypothetical protein
LKLYDWSSSANKESLEDDATLIVIDVNLELYLYKNWLI